MKMEAAGFFEALIRIYELQNVTVQNTIMFIFAVVKASKPYLCLFI